ncbi:MAG TPA: DegT/DnrJ/EryC1/StrS aminotransferase family protein [Burkholderiales bacterium]|nr:DegT/DnrJ/EryC1/StrS aminotransferase family protein [Burkholderiales bacterium]
MAPDNDRRGKAPFLPFARPQLDADEIEAAVAVLRSGWIASGPRVEAFEAALSEYLGGRTVLAFTSATAALEVALQIAGIGPGHEVIVPAMTFAATANVVLRVGARPVFVDVELESRNIDLDQLEAALTPRTRAIMPVHFAGHPVNMEALYASARRHGVRVIEDAAHAMGARWRGERIGSIGDMVVFSFHPNKNMTTIEGGALVLDQPEEVRQARRHRFHGIDRTADGEFDVWVPGGKYNLSDVAASIGLVQLARLDAFNARRGALARQYLRQLRSDPPLLLPHPGDEGHSWHMFAPLLPLNRLSIGRTQFIRRMEERGIGVGVHFPALHQLTLYRGLGYGAQRLPNAERIGRETITLPLFPAMAEGDVARVCDAAREVIGVAAAGRSGRDQP